MKARYYREGDLARIQGRDGQEMNADADINEIGALSGYTLSLYVDDQIVGAGGIYKQWEGVGSIWLLSSDGIRGHGIKLVKIARSLIKRVMKLDDLARIHCAILASEIENIKFIELLGFKRESVMRCAAPGGGDMYMYARLRNV